MKHAHSCTRYRLKITMATVADMKRERPGLACDIGLKWYSALHGADMLEKGLVV